MARQIKLATLAQVVRYCVTKPGAWLDDPWGGGHQVAKVADKMFMSAGAMQDEPAFAIRCIDMDDRDFWRDRYPEGVTSQPYMPNLAWNRVVLGKVPDADIQEMLDVSYDTVVSKLPKRSRPEGWVPIGS